jgi:FtsH-binding integral membrane protein
MLLLCGLVASIGPIGLLLGVRRVIDQRASFSRVLGWVMVGLLLAYGALGVGVKILAGPDAFGFAWYEAVLLFVLPAAVLAHLMYLGRDMQAARPAAA